MFKKCFLIPFFSTLIQFKPLNILELNSPKRGNWQITKARQLDVNKYIGLFDFLKIFLHRHWHKKNTMVHDHYIPSIWFVCFFPRYFTCSEPWQALTIDNVETFDILWYFVSNFLQYVLHPVWHILCMFLFFGFSCDLLADIQMDTKTRTHTAGKYVPGTEWNCLFIWCWMLKFGKGRAHAKNMGHLLSANQTVQS